MYVCTGNFGTTSTVGGIACTTGNNNCLNEKGHLTYFKRDPSDGSLFWVGTMRWDRIGCTINAILFPALKTLNPLLFYI